MGNSKWVGIDKFRDEIGGFYTPFGLRDFEREERRWRGNRFSVMFGRPMRRERMGEGERPDPLQPPVSFLAKSGEIS